MRAKTLDMKTASIYGVTNFDLVRKALKSDKKYRENLVYRGFDGDNIPKLLKDGQDTNEELLFAYTEKELLEETIPKTDIFGRAADFNHPTIAVFNSKNLIKSAPLGKGYTFKNPNKKLESLVAVYKLKNL